MSRRRPGRLGLLLVAVLAAGSCGGSGEPAGQVTIATGGVGGVYHAYGTGFAEILSDQLGAETAVLATAASVENLRMVAAGEAEVGFTLADSAALAVAGSPPFRQPLPVVALARLYDNYTHLVVAAELPIGHPRELAGYTVSTGARESGTELVAERLLGLAGLNPATDLDRRRLEIAESAAALRAGEIDAFFWSGGLPTAAISELAATTAIRLLDLSGFVEDLRAAHGELYTHLSIPAFAYPDLPDEVATIGIPNLLVVHEEMAPELAEQLTRMLFDHKEQLVAAHPEAERLNRRLAIATFPVRLHPGAATYYQGAKPRA